MASLATHRGQGYHEAPVVTHVAELAFADRFVRELPGDPRARQPHAPGRAGVLLARRADRRCRHPSCSRSCPRSPRCSVSTPLDPELVDVLAGNRVAAGHGAVRRVLRRPSVRHVGRPARRWPRDHARRGHRRATARPGRSSSRAPGPTPYSRTADGRAVLRSSLRELVCSEAMHHLGVPTTRALSLVATGEPIMRDMLYDGHPADEPGAVVCRVAPSFLRFGSYEIHASRDDHDTLQQLVGFTLERFYPQYVDGDARHRRVLRRGHAAHRVAGRRVDARRLRARRDEHRQHVDPRAHDRLRPVRLARAVRSRLDAEHHRRVGPALSVRQPAGGRALEPRAARARARAARGDLEPLRAAVDRVPGEFSVAVSPHDAAQARAGRPPRHDATTTSCSPRSARCWSTLETDYTLFFRRLAQAVADASRAARATRTTRPTIAARTRSMAWLARYRDASIANGSTSRARGAHERGQPLYVPRNYLVQQVIEATERGDRAALLELLDVLAPSVRRASRPRALRGRSGPKWAARTSRAARCCPVARREYDAGDVS